MARTKPEIDPEAQYRVKLTRSVEFLGQVLRPRNDVVLKGSVVTELGDAVASYEKVEIQE